MPLTTSGEGFRTWSEPRFFECDSEAQVQQIELPVDKAFAFVASTTAATDLDIWKFNSSSVAAAGPNVIVPLNPLFADAGRWFKLTIGGGGIGASGLQSGSGSPEGVADAADGQLYFDTDAAPSGQALYANLATSGKTGWFQLLQF